MRAAILYFLCFISVGTVEARQEYTDFRSAGLIYARCAGASNIYYEVDVILENKRLSESACTRLRISVSEIVDELPAHARKKYDRIKFFILLGERSPAVGLRSGMRFVRKGEPKKSNGYDQAWENGIVVYSAKNLMYLSELWTKKAVMHEMAHAWHIWNWPEKYAPIYSAWQHAHSNGLYRNVKDTKGTVIPKAYALTNQLEYFAEISAAYFVGINYYPFDRAVLSNYDPVGTKMVQLLWSTR